MLDDKGVRRRFRASNYQVCIIERMEGREKENEANENRGWRKGREQRVSIAIKYLHCYQSTTRVKPFICTMPMRLDEGWNQIQFNLADFTRRAYPTCLESEERGRVEE